MKKILIFTLLSSSFGFSLASNAAEIEIPEFKIDNSKIIFIDKDESLNFKEKTGERHTKKKLQEYGLDNNVRRKIIDSTRQKSSEGSEISGDWIFTLGDYYNGSLSDYSSVDYLLNASYDPSTGNVWFKDPADKILPFVSQFNPASGQLTFKREYLGTTTLEDRGEVYIYQEPFIFDWDIDYYVYQSIKGTYRMSESRIDFNYDNGMSWGIYSDQKGSRLIGYYDRFDFEGAHKDVPFEDNDSEWKNIGNALFMDGWVLPAFAINQKDPENMYEVALQQNLENEKLYRLVNPYHSGPAAKYNESTAEGSIEFDVTDPKHVVVNWKRLDAGFSNSSLGITKMYCYNTLTYFGWKYYYGGYTPEEIVAVAGNEIAATTFENGVITLGLYVDPDPEFNYSYYDANYGFQGNKDGGLGWKTTLGGTADMTTKIFMPGSYVSGVQTVTEDLSTPIEYFDMHGIKVATPGKGIYIKKQGLKISKIIIQ